MVLLRTLFLTLYKKFIRSQLGYVNIMYEQIYDFCEDLKLIQYNAFMILCGNNWCNKRYFNRKTMPRVRFGDIGDIDLLN